MTCWLPTDNPKAYRTANNWWWCWWWWCHCVPYLMQSMLYMYRS